MTTEQHMLPQIHARHLSLCAILALCLVFVPACTAGNQLHAPRVLTSPYGSAQGDALWAIAPLRNESGVSIIDELALADTLAAQIQQVRGISTIPVNRTLRVMQDLSLAQISSSAEALSLARALGADAIVVGSITAWDPYDPPEFGLRLGLYVTNNAAGSASVNPRALQAAATDYDLPTTLNANAPLSTAAEHLDGANHEIQQAVMIYADGRHDPSQPLGWRRYLASMTLFTEFGCHRLTERLLDSERIRLARLRASAD